jgi:cytoskeletal protein CcmA (bactofilin family)
VHCVALVLGENAQLEGSVVAEQVMVRGRLIGSIRALTVTLEARSYVEGDVFHKSLSIEQGTHFEGESRPSEDPLSASPEVPKVEPQLQNGRLDAVNQRGSVKGFMRSLPESRSA